VLVTGDLVQDDAAGYAPLRRTLERLGLPVACIPGNHDVPAELHRALRGAPFTTHGCLDLGGWRIALVDSTLPGSAAGRIRDRELQALERALGSAGARHVLLCLHHQPVPMGSRWLDEVGLENPEAFFEIVDRYSCVRGIAWGHVHQALDARRGGVRLLATPSTCAQFAPGRDEFAVDSRPPAYRILELLPDGGIVTEVVWVGTENARRSVPN
jgi:Icc protein